MDPPVVFNTSCVCERSQSLHGVTTRTVTGGGSAASDSTFPASPSPLEKPVKSSCFSEEGTTRACSHQGFAFLLLERGRSQSCCRTVKEQE